MLLIECNKAQHMDILKTTWNCRFKLHLKCRRTAASFSVYCCIFIIQNVPDFKAKNQCLENLQKSWQQKEMYEIFAQHLQMWLMSSNTVPEADKCVQLGWRYFPSLKFVPSRSLGRFLRFLEHSPESISML